MISKLKIRFLLGVLVVIVTYHLIVSSNVQRQDLQNVFDFNRASSDSTVQDSTQKAGVNRLDNPPNEEIVQSKPQNEVESIENDETVGEKPVPAKEQPPAAKQPEVELDDSKPVLEQQLEDDTENTLESIKEQAAKPDNLKDYRIFFDNLEDFAMKQPSIKKKYKTEHAKELFSTHDSFLFSKEYLENVLDIPHETYEELKDSHRRYVKERIPELLKQVKTFGNMLPTDKEWNSYKGSSGYVLVGGGRFSWLSFLVIKQMRANGSKLPIELFIATESDYEQHFCDEVLPKYNARCNVFDDKLAQELSNRFNLGGYQYKMLAILSSKFENVLYLDSDNFPTRDVDYLFESDLYKENQLLLWPDAWARTTNPKYYDIAEVEVKENKLRYSNYDEKQAGGKDKLKPLSEYTFKDSWYHDFEGALPDPTSETGMLMINKSSHLKTLLLCLYYNIFGPDFYYPLMTQGSAGEGDKETFIAAAHVMKEPWYQCAKQFKWTGYESKAEKKFVSKALAHYDPVQAQDLTNDKVDVIFMHLSYPKFYPNWLVDNHDLVYADSDEHIRMYASVNDNVGYDFDLRVLQFFTEGLCPNYYDKKTGKPIENVPKINYKDDYMGNHLLYVRGEEENNLKRCEDVFIPHLKWLKESAQIPTVVS
ncbi:Alpha-1,2-mannosyltransferase MNN2 [Candida viswanathii]|uniref:Alpha-1,2-mannosyltransferase MNN2 n=1 Tax=Candida viswanathii TaxID=5486 RepID=A0A367YDB8_9ASCO|nr:Alpha-1,2-mannosyltransferase MNN2 [Candida viswanathii]